MAAVGLMMAACSTDDNITESKTPARHGGKMRFVATFAAPAADAATRTTYTESGTNINVAWKAGDEVALIHGGVKDVVQVSTINADGSATIDGDITVGTDGETVAVVYPAASVDATGSGATFTPNTAYAAKGFAQDGTLEYIATNLDARQNTNAKLKVSGDVATLNGNVEMMSGIAIWKLSLTDGSSTLSATQLSLKVGGLPVAGTVNATGKSDYYVCVVPSAMGTGDLTIVAAAGSDVYTYTKSGGVSLTAGKYYQSEVAMTKVASAPAGVVAVDLDLPSGTKWASMNVGATSETDYGLYFAWAATTGYTGSYNSHSFKEANTPYYAGNGRWSKYTGSDGKTVLDAIDDAAVANWGGDWRMPTSKELYELLDETYHYSVKDFNGSGVNGWKYTSKYDATKYIFLPATGLIGDTSLDDVGSYGYYWSSSFPSSGGNDLSIYLYSSGHSIHSWYRYYGRAVRPVQSIGVR